MELILIRGHSGSGKTTYARHLFGEALDAGVGIEHFEADQYFINPNGEYEFDVNHLADAHEWCRVETDMAMEFKVERVIVANTFTRMWEMEPYLKLADKHGYDVRVVRMTGDYESVHGVPEDIIAKQKERMEDYPNETINTL